MPQSFSCVFYLGGLNETGRMAGNVVHVSASQPGIHSQHLESGCSFFWVFGGAMEPHTSVLNMFGVYANVGSILSFFL